MAINHFQNETIDICYKSVVDNFIVATFMSPITYIFHLSSNESTLGLSLITAVTDRMNFISSLPENQIKFFFLKIYF